MFIHLIFILVSIQNAFIIGKIVFECNIQEIDMQIMPLRDRSKLNIKKQKNDNSSKERTTIKTQKPIKKYHMKKTIKLSRNFLQESSKIKQGYRPHIINFNNILTINERAIRDINHGESFIKSFFYYKNLKAVETTDNYLVLHLGDNPSISFSTAQIITNYKEDNDPKLNSIGLLLEGLEKRIINIKPEILKNQSHQAEAFQMINKLESVPFICKISADKLVISTSLMKMFGYDSQDFIIQCLKFRMPLFEGFTAHNYYEIIKNLLSKINLLLDFFYGIIPLSTFVQLSSINYIDDIRSKNNIEYKCKMSLSMPIPRMMLMKIEQILDTKQCVEISSLLSCKEFKTYYSRYRQRQYETLQYLTFLPPSNLPQNLWRVAEYQQKQISDQQISKSVITQ